MKPSIESLEGVVWPEPEFHSSLVLRAHALRKKPIDELTTNDLRVAFNEDIGTQFIKARVIEVLTDDPAVGEMFEGDLIRAVMLSQEFRRDESFRRRIIELAALALKKDLDVDTRNEIKQARNA
jgi:hypothetical protein